MSTRVGEACPIWIALMVTLQAAASTAVLSGCKPTQEGIQTKAKAAMLEEATDPLQLQLDIARFVDRAYVRVTAAAGDIAAQTQQRRVREATVRLRIRVLRMSHDALGQPDPRVAFLTNWISAVRFRLSLQEEETLALFGEHAAVLLQAAGENEEDILKIGYKHFPHDVIDRAKDDVEHDARRQISGRPSLPEGLAPVDSSEQDLAAVLRTPLLPFAAAAGVAGMPGAIDRVRLSADGFSRVVEEIPEQFRWQSELFMLEMETSGFLAKLYARLDRLQDWADTLAKTVDDLPSEIGAELDKTITSAEESQAEFRATLSEARKLV